MPSPSRNLFISSNVPPYTHAGNTTWSPARTSDSSVALIAAMPLANSIVPPPSDVSTPSSAEICAAHACCVGPPQRLYR